MLLKPIGSKDGFDNWLSNETKDLSYWAYMTRRYGISFVLEVNWSILPVLQVPSPSLTIQSSFHNTCLTLYSLSTSVFARLAKRLTFLNLTHLFTCYWSWHLSMGLTHEVTPRLSIRAFETTCNRIFTPYFKSPRRRTHPRPPSLAASRLPPPCAEVDERPRFRIRRFKLWRDNIPALRLIVLDPNKRGERDVFVHRVGDGTPDPIALRTHVFLLAELRRYQSFAIPNRSFLRGSSSSSKHRGSLASKWTPYKPSPKPPVIPGQGVIEPFKKTKAQRRAEFQRMLQNKYVLNQEHERRFRLGMMSEMTGLIKFEWENTWVQSCSLRIFALGVDDHLVG